MNHDLFRATYREENNVSACLLMTFLGNLATQKGVVGNYACFYRS